MHRRSFLAGSAAIIATFVGSFSSGPAHACRITAPLKLDNINRADVVVVGRVSNYRIGDAAYWRKILANPKLSPEIRKWLESPDFRDRGHFDIQVDEVLAGVAPSNFSVFWTNGNFALPDKLDVGPYLVALETWPRRRYPDSPAALTSSEEPVVREVMQGPCSPAFILESSSDVANKARQILKSSVQ